MNLKSYFRDQVVNPVFESRGEYSKKVGIVRKVDEKNNVCSVRFIDKGGITSNKDNVSVKISEPGFIGWFPEKGEEVVLECFRDSVTIVGIWNQDYTDKVRSKTDMENDILSDNIAEYSEGGYVY